VPAPDSEAVRLARAELDAVIADIRKIEGFQQFLASPDFTDVELAARDHPIVYLAAAATGGFALAVRGDEVVDLDLPDLRTDALHERVDEYVRRHDAFRLAASDAVDEAWRHWADHLDEVAGWLWGAVMGPLIERLAPDLDDEIAVVPCGQLGLLPLHAAWTADAGSPTGRRYALDHAVWTYTANARALSACRDSARGRSLRRSAAVVNPEPRRDGAADLPAMLALSTVVKSALPGGPATLAGQAATVDATRGAMAEADLLFLGCHGIAVPSEPLRSRIVLSDRDLTLDEILHARLDARLVVVAACETAMVGLDLPDEVISLPTGLVQAGAAGVVASMWSCEQLATAVVLVEFFRLLGDRPPARALRDAQRLVRDDTLDSLRRRWEDALDEGAGWLPGAAGDDLLFALLAVSDEQPWQSLEIWSALSYTGA
jgi:CHAT domain-containing protein